jgi:hypothetical protein
MITAYSAMSRDAKLHASKSCTRLKAGTVLEHEMPLNSAAIKRMCADCAMYGRWARPGTSLELFLREFRGRGLVGELDSYTRADLDEDEPSEDLVAEATALLKESGKALAPTGDEEAEEDDGDTDADDYVNPLRDAESLRDGTIREWCYAAKSLVGAARCVSRYPWLSPWADKRIALKTCRADVLRERAARLLDGDALVAAAVAAAMKQPEFPLNDPAFTVLGTPSDVKWALSDLWRRWHSHVSQGRSMPSAHGGLVYFVMDSRLGGKRKGREQLWRRSAQLLQQWTDAALSEFAQAPGGPGQLVYVTIQPEVFEGDGWSPLYEKLTEWEIGALITYTVAADWATRTFLLHAPLAVATRLQGDTGYLTGAQCPVAPGEAADPGVLLAASSQARQADAGHGAFLPGTRDDTPVSRRRPVTLPEVRALRAALDEHSQLFLVCSLSDGVEVLSLEHLEERCTQGWRGVLIAEAGDLPLALVEPALSRVQQDNGEDDNRAWHETRYVEATDPTFGDHLGIDSGTRRLEQLLAIRKDVIDPGRVLRVLALARGLPDLRQIGGEYESHPGGFPHVAWQALVVEHQLDLRPFLPPNPASPRENGLGLPLAVLADVQIYSTNVDPHREGKGHSPFCQHAGRRDGIGRWYDLITAADLLRSPAPDWCARCGGYVIRRLTGTQMSYYRAAHQLLDLGERLDQELIGNRWGGLVLETAGATLDTVSGWLDDQEQNWQIADILQAQRAVNDLHQKLDQVRRQQEDGESDGGTVIQLMPKE